MKKLFTLLALITTIAIFAQAPQGFNYQATVRNNTGTLIVNQSVYFKFNVLLNSQTSVPIFTETHYVATDGLGQVNLVVGQGTATVGTFSSINWANGSYYLGIEINTGSGYVAMGTTQLLSVPYALYANSAGNSNSNLPNGTNIGDTLNWIWNGSAWVPTSSIATSQLPVVSTIEAGGIQTPSPISGGTITSDGGFSIISKGVCWSTSPNPSINNNSTNDGTGATNFTSVFPNLLTTTTYYYRAYATNSVGTGYGITYTFTTVANPQVTTTLLSAVTSTSASSGGNITSDGGASVTERGVCWSTSPNPTIALTTKTNNGSGTGMFTSTISGLTANTTYYIKSFAINNYGTAYGQEEVFTTLVTLTTNIPSLITGTSANSGGNISNGTATIIARGVCWNTSPDPTIALLTKTIDGTGTGMFTSTISGLTANTIYYVRAYATNSVGTAYGDNLYLITSSSIPLIDIDGNTYQTVQICNQTWTRTDLNVTKYRNGDIIPQVTDATQWASLTTGAWCYYNNDSANGAVYGKLYNWYAVTDPRGLAPVGYHVPSDTEWTALTTCLGAETYAGGELKETGTTHWWTPNLMATNSSGFTGVPGGYRSSVGAFTSITSTFLVWSNNTSNLGKFLSYSDGSFRTSNLNRKGGYSVRCLKD